MQWTDIADPIRVPLELFFGLAGVVVLFWALFTSIKDFLGAKIGPGIRRLILAVVVAIFLFFPQTIFDLVNAAQGVVSGIVDGIGETFGDGGNGGGNGGTGGTGGDQPAPGPAPTP